MADSRKTVYRSRIGVVVWLYEAAAAATTIACALDAAPWVGAGVGAVMFGLLAVVVLGTSYEIEGDTLTVRYLFTATRLPIAEIASVTYCRGYSATAALSCGGRVALRFTSPRVLRSYAPLEISPLRRDAFVGQLVAINPAIEVRR